ncbi:hypothetical protein DCC85_05850 [Paenibacillus sp. CAA11]|uniref:tetratricopeptide repeat protein n=1 Tax=Paenibacillus sp. CAA11 TaxID=1532905 RepID=UPI000D38F44F|nr:tetratricopeptide repeat protein [Paenibacillus sp. CAA11]AWB43793.1 hypothetical protein DCC85_05850 [Paenibacillus sp. CAA11]
MKGMVLRVNPRWKSIVFLIAIIGILVLYPISRFSGSGNGSSQQNRVPGEDLGDSYLKERTYTQAVPFFDKLLESNPDHVEIRQKRDRSQEILELVNSLSVKGDIALGKKQREKAYDYFRQANELFPANPDNLLLRFQSAYEQDLVNSYLDLLTDVNTRWGLIKDEVRGGKQVTSKTITKRIKELYFLTREIKSQSLRISDIGAPEAVELYKNNKQTINSITDELKFYLMLPNLPSQEFRDIDVYTQNVQKIVQAFGLDSKAVREKYSFAELRRKYIELDILDW